MRATEFDLAAPQSRYNGVLECKADHCLFSILFTAVLVTVKYWPYLIGVSHSLFKPQSLIIPQGYFACFCCFYSPAVANQQPNVPLRTVQGFGNLMHPTPPVITSLSALISYALEKAL